MFLIFFYQSTAKCLSLPPPLLGGVISKPLTLQFFVYLHEKHTKILDSNLEKTRPNRQITEKRKTYIYTKKTTK